MRYTASSLGTSNSYTHTHTRLPLPIDGDPGWLVTALGDIAPSPQRQSAVSSAIHPFHPTLSFDFPVRFSCSLCLVPTARSVRRVVSSLAHHLSENLGVDVGTALPQLAGVTSPPPLTRLDFGWHSINPI